MHPTWRKTIVTDDIADTVKPVNKIKAYSRIDKHNRKWYPLLVQSDSVYGEQLLKDNPLNTLQNKLIVCLTKICDDKNVRSFAVFGSHVEYYYAIKKIPVEERCFFEVIPGEFPQKPHFDIEIDEDNPKFNDIANNQYKREEIKSQIITAIIKILQQYNISIDINKDILVFSSSNDSKLSYHIVVDNYAHINNLEAKAFYKLVKSNISEEYQSFIDKAVYSKLQQFRIVGSQKHKSGRMKKLLETWDYDGIPVKYEYPEPPENEHHKYMMELGCSLVANAAYCSILPRFYEGDANRQYEQYDLSDDQVQRVLMMFENYIGFSRRSKDFPFYIRKIENSTITFTRKRPSYCKLCKRIHEHDNPYVFVKESNVFYACPRSISEFVNIGDIPTELVSNRKEKKQHNVSFVEPIKDIKTIEDKFNKLDHTRVRTSTIEVLSSLM